VWNLKKLGGYGVHKYVHEKRNKRRLHNLVDRKRKKKKKGKKRKKKKKKKNVNS